MILNEWKQSQNAVSSLKTFLKSYQWNLFQPLLPGVTLGTFLQSMRSLRCSNWMFSFGPLVPANSSIPESLTPVPLTALAGSPPEGTAKARMGFLAWLLGCSTWDVAQTRLLVPVPEEPCVRAAHGSAKYQPHAGSPSLWGTQG